MKVESYPNVGQGVGYLIHHKSFSANNFINIRVSKPIYTCKWTWVSEWLWTHLLIWVSEWVRNHLLIWVCEWVRTHLLIFVCVCEWELTSRFQCVCVSVSSPPDFSVWVRTHLLIWVCVCEWERTHLLICVYEWERTHLPSALPSNHTSDNLLLANRILDWRTDRQTDTHDLVQKP
jgi:hypothetical protein